MLIPPYVHSSEFNGSMLLKYPIISNKKIFKRVKIIIDFISWANWNSLNLTNFTSSLAMRHLLNFYFLIF